MKGYKVERRYHVLALKSFRWLGLGSDNWIVDPHRMALAYLRHQRYSE